MKKYIAIGHWKDSKNITVVASTNSSDKSFRQDLIGNAFVAYITFSEKKLEAFRTMDSMDIFDEIKKMTSNYRVWNEVADYIYQCFNVIEDRLAKA